MFAGGGKLLVVHTIHLFFVTTSSNPLVLQPTITDKAETEGTRENVKK